MWRWFLALSIAQCSQAFYDPNCDGKQVIVHLFEWKWTDVADECERYLSSTGFCGVQVLFRSRIELVLNNSNSMNFNW